MSLINQTDKKRNLLEFNAFVNPYEEQALIAWLEDANIMSTKIVKPEFKFVVNLKNPEIYGDNDFVFDEYAAAIRFAEMALKSNHKIKAVIQITRQEGGEAD